MAHARGWQAVAVATATIAAAVIGSPRARAADGVNDLYVHGLSAEEEMDRALGGVKSGADAAAATAITDAAKALDAVTADVAAAPPYTTADLSDLPQHHRDELNAEHAARDPAMAHVKLLARDGGKVADALAVAVAARARFFKALRDAAVPVTSDRQKANPTFPQRATVMIRGVRNRDVPLNNDVRFWAIVDHVTRGSDPATTTVVDDGDDETVSFVAFYPSPDLNALAGRADFGTVRVEPECRVVIVDADPAKVDPIAKSYVPPRGMAIPPPPGVAIGGNGGGVAAPAVLPKVLQVGDHVLGKYHKQADDWRPATVVRRDRGQYKIHFDGQPTTDDQWVDRSALRPPGAATH